MKTAFQDLRDFITRTPGVQTNETSSRGIGCGENERIWWIKFSLDIAHPLAWHVVQELAHVLNLLSVEDRLPTVFKPVSPPRYLNGSPRDFLSWVIECLHSLTPATVLQWLQGRLPRPVDDLTQWGLEDEPTAH
jgi:hypothetical protein